MYTRKEVKGKKRERKQSSSFTDDIIAHMEKLPQSANDKLMRFIIRFYKVERGKTTQNNSIFLKQTTTTLGVRGSFLIVKCKELEEKPEVLCGEKIVSTKESKI